MALFTDQLWPTPAMINSINGSMRSDLDSCGGLTVGDLSQLAYSHCASILQTHLQSVTGAVSMSSGNGVSDLHNSAVLWGIRSQSNVVSLRMGQIVMDDLYRGDGQSGISLTGPLSSWIAHWAIVLGYRQLMGRADMNLDRFKTKYDFWRMITSREKWPLLKGTGLPYVRVPLPAPGALFEQGSGTWSASNVTQTSAAGSTSGGNFMVAVTWVDQTSYTSAYQSPLTKNNAESAPSCIYPTDIYNKGYVQKTVDAQNVLKIDINSLVPPAGRIAPAESSVAGMQNGTRTATGWNIYVGSADDGSPTSPQGAPMYLQNATPIPVTTKVYTFTTDPVNSGYVMGPGQYPDANKPLPDIMMRS